LLLRKKWVILRKVWNGVPESITSIRTSAVDACNWSKRNPNEGMRRRVKKKSRSRPDKERQPANKSLIREDGKGKGGEMDRNGRLETTQGKMLLPLQK
jgi:hypothetical protein